MLSHTYKSVNAKADLQFYLQTIIKQQSVKIASLQPMYSHILEINLKFSVFFSSQHCGISFNFVYFIKFFHGILKD